MNNLRICDISIYREHKGGTQMKRKIYDELLKWKEKSNGEVALLIDGARRIGKVI